jgi:preprotein translocase subunit SecE
MAKKADSKEVVSSKKDTAAKTSKSAKGSNAKAAKTKDTKKKGGIKKYFRDLKSEIKKVVWPSRAKVINNSGIVISVMIALGLLLFGIDSALSAGIKALLTIGG